MQNKFNNEKNNSTRYTFDNFVVGDNNRFAYELALAVTKAPGKIYNPAFIYSENGLGKTHLMHAIENKVLENYPNLKVLYISSNEFVNELIKSIKENITESFRDKYKNVDVFLIDDIQFIAGKERVQEEVFYAFNYLIEKGKQIVISSDKPPKDIAFLENRLKYRFESGLIADISEYDYDARLKILKREIKEKNVVINDDIISVIAKKFSCNIMELKGVFNIVVAYSNLLDKELSKKELNKIIEDIII